MATTVDSTNIVSARDRAEAFFYGTDYRAPNLSQPAPAAPTVSQPAPATPPAPAPAPVMAEYTVPAEAPTYVAPKLTQYVPLEDQRQYQPSPLRGYMTAPEEMPFVEPQVLSSAISGTEETTPAVVNRTKPARPTVLDLDLAEDAQYVVRLKKPAVVVVAALAVVFVLLTALFIANIVSLASAAHTIGQLTEQSRNLDRSLAAAAGNPSPSELVANLNPDEYQRLTQTPLRADEVGDYQVTVPDADNDFFNWLCQGLSNVIK